MTHWRTSWPGMAWQCADPVWRLPFWQRYHEMISSRVADINNAGTGGFAGSITAALFLERFVEKAKAYVHLDIYGWVPAARPARPLGGEPQQHVPCSVSLQTDTRRANRPCRAFSKALNWNGSVMSFAGAVS
jgi:leucyl aminopeptidase